jgi:hypothetical protein
MLNMVFKFMPEMLQHGAHRHRSSITQSANGTPLNILGHAIQQIHIASASLTILNPVNNTP